MSPWPSNILPNPIAFYGESPRKQLTSRFKGHLSPNYFHHGLLAATWLLGGLSLRMLWLIFSSVAFVAGIWVVAMPVRDAWDSFQTHAHDYDNAISDLRQAVAKSSGGFDPDAFHKRYTREQTATPQKGDIFDQIAPGRRQQGKKAPPVDFIPDQFTIEDPPAKAIVWDIEIPESTQLWQRPDAKIPVGATAQVVEEGVTPFVTSIPRPTGMKDEEIINTIRTQMLVPRPTFSLRVPLGSHKLYSLIGLALIAGGLLSFAWCMRDAMRASRKPT